MHKSSLSIFCCPFPTFLYSIIIFKEIFHNIYTVSDQLLQYYSNTKLKCASLPQNLSSNCNWGKWSKIFVCHLLNLFHIYVGHKVWICAIHGSYANHGSVLCAGNPWIVHIFHLNFFCFFGGGVVLIHARTGLYKPAI